MPDNRMDEVEEVTNKILEAIEDEEITNTIDALLATLAIVIQELTPKSLQICWDDVQCQIDNMFNDAAGNKDIKTEMTEAGLMEVHEDGTRTPIQHIEDDHYFCEACHKWIFDKEEAQRRKAERMKGVTVIKGGKDK